MNNPIKLKCPYCIKEFTTTRRDKIWCDRQCAKKYAQIKTQIDLNKQHQKLILDDAFEYDYELDKFYVKAFRFNKTL